VGDWKCRNEADSERDRAVDGVESATGVDDKADEHGESGVMSEDNELDVPTDDCRADATVADVSGVSEVVANTRTTNAATNGSRGVSESDGGRGSGSTDGESSDSSDSSGGTIGGGTTKTTDNGGTSVDNAQKPYGRSKPLRGISALSTQPEHDRATLRPMAPRTTAESPSSTKTAAAKRSLVEPALQHRQRYQEVLGDWLVGTARAAVVSPKASPERTLRRKP